MFRQSPCLSLSLFAHTIMQKSWIFPTGLNFFNDKINTRVHPAMKQPCKDKNENKSENILRRHFAMSWYEEGSVWNQAELEQRCQKDWANISQAICQLEKILVAGCVKVLAFGYYNREDSEAVQRIWIWKRLKAVTVEGKGLPRLKIFKLIYS